MRGETIWEKVMFLGTRKVMGRISEMVLILFMLIMAVCGRRQKFKGVGKL